MDSNSFKMKPGNNTIHVTIVTDDVKSNTDQQKEPTSGIDRREQETNEGNTDHLGSLDQPTTRTRLIESQEKDKFISKILRSMHLPREFVKHQGVLFRKQRDKLVLALPAELHTRVIHTLHNSITSAHLSRRQIHNEMRKRFYTNIHELRKHTEALRWNCSECMHISIMDHNLTKERSRFTENPGYTWIIYTHPIKNIHSIPHPSPSDQINNNVFISMDTYSHHITMGVGRQDTSLKDIILTDIEPHFGLPKHLILFGTSIEDQKNLAYLKDNNITVLNRITFNQSIFFYIAAQIDEKRKHRPLKDVMKEYVDAHNSLAFPFCPRKITKEHKKLTDTIFDTLTPDDDLFSLPTNGFTLELYKYKIANKLTVNKTNKAAKTFQI